MSIAALQRQLSASKIGDVALATYFSDLCEHHRRSMIGGPRPAHAGVKVDESTADAEVSVSPRPDRHRVVITPSSTAFPRHRRGENLVEYHSAERLDAVRP
jgi:hypothetical protein